jgi:hydroxyquinol 1,2-dioxygenase
LRNLNQDNITQAVIDRLDAAPDPRLKEIMTSLVRHLHEFAREVRLTEEEWFRGIDFLTASGTSPMNIARSSSFYRIRSGCRCSLSR